MFSTIRIIDNRKAFGKVFIPLLCLLIWGTYAADLWELDAAGKPPDTKNQKLTQVLNGTASYCENLKKQVFHFLCREQILEICEKAYEFPFERRGLKDFLERNKSGELDQYDASRTKMDRLYEEIRKGKMLAKYKLDKHQERITLVNEYRILKDGTDLKEQRNLVELNGKKPAVKDPGLKTILYSYKNTLYPIYLFAREHQGKYRYRLVKKTGTMNRSAWIIEVQSRKGVKSSKAFKTLAKAWVDAEDYSVLKVEVFPEAFHGFEYLLKKLPGMFDVKINDVHFFGFQRNGIRFPSKTEIYLSYREEPKVGIEGVRHGAVVLNNVTTTYTYKDYLFYRAKASEPVFKKIVK